MLQPLQTLRAQALCSVILGTIAGTIGLSVVASGSANASRTSFTADVIYDEDNRDEPEAFEKDFPDYTEWSHAVAAMIPPENMIASFGAKSAQSSSRSNEFSFVERTLHSEFQTCSTERFSDQVVASYCSGFLIDPETIISAGHCFEKIADCDDYRWVFDYKESAKTPDGKLFVKEENIYRCRKVISRKAESFATMDYLVIKLDRPVLDRAPLTLRTEGVAPSDASLVVIGHPSGLPMKIANKGHIIENDTSQPWFTAALDTYHGNSGSPIIDENTGMVEGILVSGTKDLYPVETTNDLGTTSCNKSVRCTDQTCGGETVTRILEVEGINGKLVTQDPFPSWLSDPNPGNSTPTTPVWPPITRNPYDDLFDGDFSNPAPGTPPPGFEPTPETPPRRTLLWYPVSDREKSLPKFRFKGP